MSEYIEISAKLDGDQIGNAVEEVFRDRSSFVRDIKELMDVPDRGELDDYKYDWINSSDFEQSVEASIDSWMGNSDLYYLPDTVSELQHAFEEQDSKYDSIISDMEHTLNEYDFDQIQDDLNRDEEAIDDLKERVRVLEGSAEDLEEVDNSQANRLRTLEEDNLHERLEKVEGRLDMDDWSEEDNREISGLQDRVLELEKHVANLLAINERQMHIIKNIQGVTIT